jgi:PAS domain S-box-containing protein
MNDFTIPRKSLLEQILSTSTDTAIAVINIDFQPIYINISAENYFNCSSEEVQEGHFRSPYEQSPAAPYHSIDAKARLLQVNRIWLNTFGYRREETIGRSLVELAIEPQRETFTRAFERFTRDGEVHGIQASVHHADGHVLAVSVPELSATPDDNCQRNMDAGAEICLTKPFDSSALFQQPGIAREKTGALMM